VRKRPERDGAGVGWLWLENRELAGYFQPKTGRKEGQGAGKAEGLEIRKFLSGRLKRKKTSLPASLVTAVGQHPFPKVLKAAKNVVPPDRGHGHLDFGSEGTENTNGTRGDHGCGLSGAQATAQNKRR
jgi:hypothetical protein